MKKTFISLIFIFSFFYGFTQTYLPLLEDNNEWNVLAAGTAPYPNWDTVYSTINYLLSGDTVINSISYKKLYYSSEEIPLNWEFYCLLKEDSTYKVWLRFENEDQDYLMYDFSVNLGDTVIVGQYDPVDLIVDSVTTITINETVHKKYWFTCINNPYYHEYWIEGIGSNQGIVWSGSAMIVGGFYRLLCLSKNEVLYFMNPEYNTCYLNTVGINDLSQISFEIYPNPTKGTINLKYSKELEIKSITINDLFGQLVEEFEPNQQTIDITALSKGIYLLKILVNQGQYVKKIIVD